MSDIDINCEVCGGNDFYNQDGFYYCNECQTQSQQVREQVFADDGEVRQILASTRLKTVKKPKESTCTTSWETYNCLLAGLTNEILELGALHEFKDITYLLWTRYMHEVQLLSCKKDAPPRLPLNHTRIDAAVIYNKKYKRRRKEKIDIKNLTGLTKAMCIGSTKRSLYKKDYESTAKAQEELEKTLADLILENKGNNITKLMYNKYARQALLQVMSTRHLYRHLKDLNGEMRCHQFLRNRARESARKDITHVTKNKLFCLIYLALLLTGSDFQVADIIRAVREGRLSLLSAANLIPEDVDKNDISQQVLTKGNKIMFHAKFIRINTYNILELLDLIPCNFKPDLLMLCRRYCTELNLPDEIYRLAGNLLIATNPKMEVTESNKTIPNYEARAMSFVIFAIKFLFGLDSVTENELTKFGRELNENRKKGNKKIFVWGDWMNYIEYRKMVLKHVHFPTEFQLDAESNGHHELFLKFAQQNQNKFYSSSEEVSRTVIKRFLGKMLALQGEDKREEHPVFNYSFTPYRSYIRELKKTPDFTVKGYPLRKDLLKDFSKYTVEYLLDSAPFLNMLNPENAIQIKPGGANINFQYMQITSRKNKPVENEKYFAKTAERNNNQSSLINLKNKLLKKRLDLAEGKINYQPQKPTISVNDLYQAEKHKYIAIKNKVGRDSSGRFCSLKSSNLDPNVRSNAKKRSEWFLSSWTRNPKLEQHVFNPSLVKLVQEETVKNKVQTDEFEQANEIEEPVKTSQYKTHFVPRSDLWINQSAPGYHTDCANLEKLLPSSFKWLVEECARVIEQPVKCLLREYKIVELYLCYVHLNQLPVENEMNLRNLQKNIAKAKSSW